MEDIRQILNTLTEAEKEVDLNKLIAGTALLKSEKSTNAIVAGRALIRASQGEVLSAAERKALSEYIDLFTTLLTIPNLRARLKDMQRMVSRKSKKDDDAKEDE
jgi:hypothetical protein